MHSYSTPATLDPKTPTREYGCPATREAYLPDRDQPIDHWFQAENSSNVHTTREIVNDLYRRVYDRLPSALVDPFAGAGSTAVTARLLGIPFFGIELDPGLACVTVAKTLSRTAHMHKLKVHHRLWRRRRHKLVRSCLEIVQRIRSLQDRPLPPQHLLTDLESSKAPPRRSTIVWGDATDASSWSAAKLGKLPLIYTSPPFGRSSPRLALPAELRASAERALKRRGRKASPGPSPAVFPSYGDLVVGMLQQAGHRIERGMAIIEHEPPDDGADELQGVARRITEETGFRVNEILTTTKYSDRGVFSLIVCTIGLGT